MQRSDIAQQKVARLLIEVFRYKVLRLWQFVRNNRLLADEIYRYVTEIVLPVSKCFSMSKTPPLNDKQLLVRKETSLSKRSQGFWIEVFRCKVLRLWQFVRNNRLLADEFYRYVTKFVLSVKKCFSTSKIPPLNDKQLLVRKET